jgi:hypothetical protein
MPGITDGYTRHGVLAAAISNGIVSLMHSPEKLRLRNYA